MAAPTVESLTAEMQSAMKSGDRDRVSVLRMLMAALKNARVKKMADLTDEEVLRVISKEVSKREEAAEAFEKGGRRDKADSERAEAEVLRVWLPARLDDSELEELVAGTIEEVGAQGPSDMGKVMGALMPKVSGRADGSKVAQMVKSRLT